MWHSMLTFSLLFPLFFHKYKMWSALKIIPVIIFNAYALTLFGAFGYAIGYAILRPNVPHRAKSPLQFAHPVPSPIINVEEIELSDLTTAPYYIQSPIQSVHSCSFSTIDLEEVGISVNHLPALPSACSSSPTLNGAPLSGHSRLVVEI
jgi:hypothetical protein